jgi:hypothetical protein
MTSVLVSGVQAQVAAVAAALRQHDVSVTEVADIADVPAVCAEAGDAAFDCYVQLGATIHLEGDSAVQRVHHFYAAGVLARFTALDAARTALKPGASVVFVMGTLPQDVATKADREARMALTNVLGRAAQADAEPSHLTVRILDTSTEPERIAALALGMAPPPRPDDPSLDELSLTDWRVELMSMVLAET